jgi:alkanesulfonate monooxygenase SsuD/methylene tetrahydromethanopterin reductase-like flavin-dependent oxidoreductase (luciferase family)
MAKPGSCTGQTWPNISPECITGRGEPAKVAEKPAIAPEQPSSFLLRPTKLLQAVPDPEVTGSLPGSAELAARNHERPVVANAKKPIEDKRARAERKSLREAGRRSRFSPNITVADRAAPEPAARASEPIQFRLAEGN